MIFLFCWNKIEIELLQDDNPLIILSLDHPSSEDELKWIDMGYHQGLVKENVVNFPYMTFHTRLLIPFSRIYADLILKPVYI